MKCTHPLDSSEAQIEGSWNLDFVAVDNAIWREPSARIRLSTFFCVGTYGSCAGSFTTIACAIPLP